MKIGETLKDLRLDKKITQKDLSERLGITVPTLSHWECNYQEPSIFDLIKISDFFGVSIDYLVGKTDDFMTMNFASMDLSDEEKRLLKDYRSLAEPLKKMIRDTISTFKTSDQNTQDKRRVK